MIRSCFHCPSHQAGVSHELASPYRAAYVADCRHHHFSKAATTQLNLAIYLIIMG